MVYYEEYGDVDAAKDRERQLKGWSRAKKNGLVVKMNPKWRDLISEWEDKYGLEFRPDNIVLKQSQKPTTRSFDSGIPRWRKRAGTLLRSGLIDHWVGSRVLDPCGTAEAGA